MGQKMPLPVINLGLCPKTPAWYTVVTKYNYEKKFADDLMTSLKGVGLQNDILEVVVPIKETEIITKTSTGKDKKTVKVEKIYPLYVFVKAIMSEKVWNHLRLTNGASTVLATGGFPSIMDDYDIRSIKKACGLDAKEREQRKANFNGKIGDAITVTSGVFSGFAGKITFLDLHKGKCKISLDMNGIPLDMQITDIELLQ